MAKAQTLEKSTGGIPLPEAEAFYHYGLLPAKGKVQIRVPDRANGGKETLKDFDTWDLYRGGVPELSIAEEGDLSIFIGQFRQRQQGECVGCVFPAVSEAVEWRGGDFGKTAFPGQVMKKSGPEVADIVKDSFKHFVRFGWGIENRMHPECPFTMHDMDHGAKPADMSDEEWMAYRRQAAINGRGLDKPCPAFNPKTDILMAEFVYLYRLDLSEKEADFDEETYTKNPNVIHARMVGPVTKKFFTNPPASIAEMYSPEGLLR